MQKTWTLAQAQANVTPADAELIAKIVQRAMDLLREYGRPASPDGGVVIAAKITHAHGGACPLKLWQWLASAQGDFAHDFFGIGSWMNTQTGLFTNPDFWPIHAEKPASVH